MTPADTAAFCLAPLRDHIGKPEYAECVRRIVEAIAGPAPIDAVPPAAQGALPLGDTSGSS